MLQIVALGLVYPSVVLIYFGEAAYLMNNTQDFAQSYFKVSLPISSPAAACLRALTPARMLVACIIHGNCLA